MLKRVPLISTTIQKTLTKNHTIYSISLNINFIFTRFNPNHMAYRLTRVVQQVLQDPAFGQSSALLTLEDTTSKLCILCVKVTAIIPMPAARKAQIYNQHCYVAIEELYLLVQPHLTLQGNLNYSSC